MATWLNRAINYHAALPVVTHTKTLMIVMAIVFALIANLTLILQIASIVQPTLKYTNQFYPDYLPASTMRCLQVNIHSVNTSWNHLHDIVNDEDIDVVGVCETWSKGEFKFKNWLPLTKSRYDGYGGVALLINDTKVKTVPRPDYEIYEHLEILWAQVEICKQAVNVASVYIPPQDRCTGQLYALIANIEFVMSVSKLPILVMGDLNARSYSWEHWHTDQANINRDNFTSFERGRFIVGRGVKWEILSKLLEGLHGVAIGTKKNKSIKIFGLGPHIRYATLTPSRFSIFYINFYIA